MGVSAETGKRLMQAVRDAEIRVLGHDLMKNDAEARLMRSVILAYGASPAGFIYGSPSRAKSTLRPPDVVLCHPEVGLLIVETKGHTLGAIQSIEAGNLLLRYHNQTRPVNVIRQADEQLYAIKGDIGRVIRDRQDEPLIISMVAFPFITEAEWQARGYHEAHPSTQLLFREQIDDPALLRARVGQLVDEMARDFRRPRPLTVEQIAVVFRVFGNSDVINESRPARPAVARQKLGAIIDDLVASEKFLSDEQKAYSALTIGRHPRLIRGVAGSGKSIVLANLVARHLQRETEVDDADDALPVEARVAVTCFNQALVPLLHRKIETAYREQALNQPIPAGALVIAHLNDLMYRLARRDGWPIDYIRVADVDDNAARARLYRGQIARFAAEQPERYAALCFDVLFVDEGQDFEADEFRLLLDLIRPAARGEKPLIVFYDDAQNLYGRPRPVWTDVGISLNVGQRVHVMRECFRNTREIVEVAFNVLMGSHAPARANVRAFADVTYLKAHKLIEETRHGFRIHFTERTAARPTVRRFPTRQAEIAWIAGEVRRLVEDEEVRLEDMLIVFSRPAQFDYGALKTAIAAAMPEKQIRFIEPFGSSDDKQAYIFQPDCLTVSTVYGAKGYDAPIVFLAGVDSFPTDAEGRAAFYVGATRARLLLTLTGVGMGPGLLDESARAVAGV